MPIVSFYAALLSVLYIVLSFRVIGLRRSARIGFGDGGNPALLRRQRVHGNFAEYVPLGLLLMAFAALQQSPGWLLHLAGLLLLAGRGLHAYGVGQEPGWLPGRAGGMVMTFAALTIGAIANLRLGLAAF